MEKDDGHFIHAVPADHSLDEEFKPHDNGMISLLDGHSEIMEVFGWSMMAFYTIEHSELDEKIESTDNTGLISQGAILCPDGIRIMSINESIGFDEK